MESSGQKILVFLVVLFIIGTLCGFLGVGGGFSTWAIRSNMRQFELAQEYFSPQLTASAISEATVAAIATVDATHYPEWDPASIFEQSSTWPVLEDSFVTTYDEVWELEHRESKIVTATHDLVGEQFQISLLGPGLFDAAAFAPRLNLIAKPFSVRVDCQTISGDGSCGLIFWAAIDNWWNSAGKNKFVRFTVRGNEFLIENGYSSLSLYPQASGLINSGAMNRLQAVVVDGMMFFYINGELVETYASRLRGGRIGIFVNSPADIERGTFGFENFEVRAP